MIDSRPKSKQPMPDRAELKFSGILYDIYQWEQKLYDGSVGVFEKCVRKNDSVNILPINKRNKILITEQKQPLLKPFIGLVGGVIDPGEEPDKAAKRELLEEIGVKTDQLDLWFSVQPSASMDWAVYTYIARDVEVTEPQNLDGGEKIHIKEVDLEQFLEIVARETFRDSEVALKVLRIQQTKGVDFLKQIFFEGK